MSNQGSRPHQQSKSPKYSSMKDYWVPKWDHQHPNRIFSHPPEQKSQRLPSRTPSSLPHAGILAATPVRTPIYQHVAPPVATILGLCSSTESPLCSVACLHPGIFTQALKSANSHTLHTTELISELILQRPDSPNST
ncbi:Hypothetical predicted protein [Marmota monax]|uniref:Uncharacterized protein n=1 Tax=Marmota monax TaxID=9995 RepID=A0A5E4BMS6_MARMO|nr:Hypothetical predicted protein [Marmota monax]